MLQLVENQELGKGQSIAFDMARGVGTKVFQVYRPTSGRRRKHEYWFEDRHIDIITAKIEDWYNNRTRDDENNDSEVTVIRPQWVDMKPDRIKLPKGMVQNLNSHRVA